MLTDFYENTTKNFSVDIELSGSAPDITSDTVTLMMRLSSSLEIYSSSADVASSGSNGTAYFTLNPTWTTKDPGIYCYEIFWETSGSLAEYVIDEGEVAILDRLSV